MPTVGLSPLPKMRFEAVISGVYQPAVGYKLYTYITGTTTPKTSYTDSTGTVANTNPIILDANGEASIWLDGIYRLELKTNTDILVSSTDGVSTNNTLAIFRVSDVTGLLSGLGSILGQTVEVASYHPNWSGTTAGPVGGGTFVWDSNKPKSNHNGGSIISPTVPWDGTQANLAAFLDGIGETAPSTNGCWIRINQSNINVVDFGAIGNDTNDAAASIRKAVLFCQASSNASLFFHKGIYRIGSTIILGASGTNGIAFVGETASPQQGSNRPAVTIRWSGGATPIFDLQSTYFRFFNMAFENFTTATDVFYLTSAMHMIIDGCSFVVGNGATRFSRSVIHTDGNEFGYSVVRDCEIINPAPRFLDIDGIGTPNGITPILFENNVIESNSLGALSVVYVKDEVIDILTFKANTFNGQANAQLTIVDTTDTPALTTIEVLNFYDNEIDLVANIATDRCFRLTNVKNVNMCGNQIQGGGAVNSIAALVNSTVTQFYGNSASSVAGPVFSADGNSRVFPGHNMFNVLNTLGISSDPGTGKSGGVLQTVSATFSTQTILGITYADIITVSITPSSKTSKILIIAHANGLAVNGTTTSIQAQITRDGTSLSEFEKEAGYAGSVTTQLSIGGIGTTLMDAPGTVSTLTYKIQMKKTGSAGAFVCTSSSTASITVMELAA